MKIPLPKTPTERLCPNGIIDTYLDYADEQECPKDFHLWVILSIIAVTMGRNAWKDRGLAGRIFPNMYIILVGESALVHKSTAINMGMNPLRESLPETVIITQKVTPEALIHLMAETCEATGNSEVVIQASELSVLLGQAKLDDSFLKILTDFWDSPNKREYRTIGRGIDICNNVCLNLLGGTTPDWLKNTIPIVSMEGGFLSRLILVNREASDQLNPHPEDVFGSFHVEMLGKIQNDLQIIHEAIVGPYEWELKAKNMFGDWYCNDNPEDIKKAFSFMRGYYGRKGDLIIKIAMINAASKSNEKVITQEDVFFAISILKENEIHTRELMKMLGTTEEGKITQNILNKILKSHVMAERDGGLQEVIGIGRSKLMRNTGHQLNARGLNDVIYTLQESGQIIVETVGGKTIYVDATQVAGKNRKKGKKNEN